MKKLEELKNSMYWENRLEYAIATNDWLHLKDDECPENRYYAQIMINKLESPKLGGGQINIKRYKNKIMKFKKELNCTWKQLSEIMDVPKTTLFRVATKSITPTLPLLIKIHNFFNPDEKIEFTE